MAARAIPSRLTTGLVLGLLLSGAWMLAQDPGALKGAAARSRLHIAIPVALPFGIVAIAAVFLVILRREGRLRAQREMLRGTYELGEEILGSSSADQILNKVRSVVPRVFKVSNAELYMYNRHAKTLDALEHSGLDPVSIPLAAPPAGPEAGAVACFHYRTLLAIPDTSRSPCRS